VNGHRLGRLGVTLLLAFAPLFGAAQWAHADSVQFRYWNYWVVQDGDWALPQMLPEERSLKDMDVDGWHFGVWGDDGGQPPRALPNFTSLCPTLAAKPPKPGVIRVAIVLDPGIGTDAPTGEQPGVVRTACLTLSGKPDGSIALKAASTYVRTEQGQVCAIDGYPRSECKPQIGGPTPSFTGALPSQTDTTTATASATGAEANQKSSWSRVSPLLLGGLGSLLLIGGAALAISQRPRK
jgi:hypothetical protein